MSLATVGTKQGKAVRTAERKAYSVPELVQSYPVSIAFLRDEIKKGALRAKRFGKRRVLVMAEDWERYLASAKSMSQVPGI